MLAITKKMVLSTQVRQRALLPGDAYDLVSYLGYIFYPPLYIAGPILTFNSFASQLKQPIPINLKQVGVQSSHDHTCLQHQLCVT